MSIGKNSIARAAGSVAAPKTTVAKKKEAPSLVPAGYLSVACADIQPLCAAPAEADRALLDSVRKYGIIEPLIICRTPDGVFYLAAGCRRLSAARQLAMKEVPARVFDVQHIKEAMRLYQVLSSLSVGHSEKLLDAKFNTVVSLADDMPDYLL